MGMGVYETSKFPNGNITTSTFVKLDATKEGYALQAGAGDECFGIAGPEPHIMAIAIQGVQLDDGLAGVAGGPAIKIYGVGATMVPLKVSSAVNIGDRLISDASGYGTPTTADKQKVGAIAQQAGAANTVVLVNVVRFDSSV